MRMNGLSGEIHAKTTNGGVKGLNIDASIFEGAAVNGGVEPGTGFGMVTYDRCLCTGAVILGSAS